jgi:hypothetical protein
MMFTRMKLVILILIRSLMGDKGRIMKLVIFGKSKKIQNLAKLEKFGNFSIRRFQHDMEATCYMM